MKLWKTYQLILAFILILSCHQSTNTIPKYNYPVPEQINDGWETAELSSVGMRPAPLVQMMNILDETEHSVHSILIIKDNKLVFEEYLEGYLYSNNPPGSNGDYIEFNRDVIHFLASVTKSVTSTLVGIAIQRGDINSVNDEIIDYLPQYADILVEEKAGITVKHLLTMSSGLSWDEDTYPYGDPRNDITQLFYSSDPIRYILEKPLVALPGSSFVYKGGDTNLLARLIIESSETSFVYFVNRYLFQPLGIEDYIWERFNNRDYFASGGLYLRPRDLAKIGSLFLNDGRWNGQQIISDQWIQDSQYAHITNTQSPWAHAYGYQWWIRNFETEGKIYSCFFAAGWGDQHMFIFPEENMIILINSGGFSPGSEFESYDLVESYILKTIIN